MTTSDLRWLVRCGYLLHAREITGLDDSDRRFDSQSQSLVLYPNTCFVLTASGLALLGRSIGDCSLPVETLHAEPLLSEIGACERPSAPKRQGIVREARTGRSRTDNYADGGVAFFGLVGACESICFVPLADRFACGCRGTTELDADSRTFMVGEHLVKQFRVPSQNQEAVLNAFQEEGWPRFVDDPLTPLPNRQPKQRLRDTIKCLNLNQITRAIRFRGDGTGQRVAWELLIDASATVAASLPLRRAA